VLLNSVSFDTGLKIPAQLALHLCSPWHRYLKLLLRHCCSQRWTSSIPKTAYIGCASDVDRGRTAPPQCCRRCYQQKRLLTSASVVSSVGLMRDQRQWTTIPLAIIGGVAGRSDKAVNQTAAVHVCLTGSSAAHVYGTECVDVQADVAAVACPGNEEPPSVAASSVPRRCLSSVKILDHLRASCYTRSLQTTPLKSL
jgi:hypothetical protein